MTAKETDQLFDHEYDGIREYDNPTPAWWNWLFIGTVVFSVIYTVHYHVTGTGASVAEEYAAEMQRVTAIREKEARARAKSLNEGVIAAIMADPAKVAEGKAKYEAVCVACHGMKGEGLVGPNLTDDYWIHGRGSLMDIRKVVAEGVVEKGMVAWENQMPPELLIKVVAYVGTLRGTQVPGKAPQGEKLDAAPE